MPEVTDLTHDFIPQKLYPFKEVQSLIPASDATFWRWEKAGLVTFVRIGKARFMRGCELSKLIREGAQEVA